MNWSADRQRRLFEILAAQEPVDLRTGYLAHPGGGSAFNLGTTTPAIGTNFIQLGGGQLWVPADTAVRAAPIDNFGQYLAARELFGEPWGFTQLRDLLSGVERRTILTTCAAAINGLRDDLDGERTFALDFADQLVEPYRTKARNLIQQKRVVFTREALLALAKCAIVLCPDDASPELSLGDFGLMAVALHDMFAESTPELEQPSPGEFSSAVVSWIAANQLLHKSFDAASLLTSFESRWSASRPSQMQELCGAFEQHLGFSIEQQAQVAISVWSGVQTRGRVVVQRSWFEPLKLDEKVLDQILRELSISLDSAARTCAHEIELGELNWNISTFERHPLIRCDADTFLVIDAGLLLRRCMGWAPLYAMEEHLSKQDRQRFAQVLERGSEDYVVQILEEMYRRSPAGRLFREPKLKQMAPGKKVADVAIDFGGRWAVIEISARRVPRAVVHGHPSGGEDLVAMALEELRQVASTATWLQSGRGAFTGEKQAPAVRIYPLLVMAEGFPANPIVTAEVRRRALAEGLFSDVSASAIEIIDLEELEMIEQLVEEAGSSLPDVLDAKAASPFHADSLRAFLLASGQLKRSTPRRVNRAFAAPLERLGEKLLLQEHAPQDGSATS